MKAEELRIGNIVKSGKGIYRIYALSHPMILAIQSVEFKIDSEKGVFSSDSTILEPIPLSEDLLLKCGFVNGKNLNWGNPVIDIDGVNWMGSSFDGNIFFNQIKPPCKYLHQLQNLYYTLTGKELEINL